MAWVPPGNRSNQHIQDMNRWLYSSKQAETRQATRAMIEQGRKQSIIRKPSAQYPLYASVRFNEFKSRHLGIKHNIGVILAKRRIDGFWHYKIKCSNAIYHDVSELRIVACYSLAIVEPTNIIQFKAQVQEAIAA